MTKAEILDSLQTAHETSRGKGDAFGVWNTVVEVLRAEGRIEQEEPYEALYGGGETRCGRS